MRRKMRTMSRAQNSVKNSVKRTSGNPEKIKAFQWPKGVSGNPGGRFANVRVSELPARIRKKFAGCDDLTLAAAGALGLFVAMHSGSHSAGKELREGIEGKLTEKIDLTVDVNKDIVQRLMAARKRASQSNNERAS